MTNEESKPMSSERVDEILESATPASRAWLTAFGEHYAALAVKAERERIEGMAFRALDNAAARETVIGSYQALAKAVSTIAKPEVSE